MIPHSPDCFLDLTAATPTSLVILNQKFAVPGCAGDFENTPVSGVRSARSGLRFYSPGTGRWLSRDPIDENGGLNLYAFVANNSINAIDAYGLYAYAVLTTDEILKSGPKEVIFKWDNRWFGQGDIWWNRTLKRRCVWRCYRDTPKECTERPCKCEKDHGVEVAITVNAIGKGPAATCDSLTGEVTAETLRSGTIARNQSTLW